MGARQRGDHRVERPTVEAVRMEEHHGRTAPASLVGHVSGPRDDRPHLAGVHSDICITKAASSKCSRPAVAVSRRCLAMSVAVYFPQLTLAMRSESVSVNQ